MGDERRRRRRARLSTALAHRLPHRILRLVREELRRILGGRFAFFRWNFPLILKR
jgi:hypothetical protein